ncbi:nuclear transport factor 2 family protein [Haliangium ochraceum]|uniref:SnoaL-like domain-containing protein n=1 Tax=Haliangium ochraceum (strain DSM 14365 / JCM 11303 / SMP-2) TaxID=502025 RepID=D0LWN0_HALO1|nr:nuclear transport factor 2 family protein [Haliangium ochraceum]ACY17680.1 hypothetical protein Hoch_5192 [Haliangium ochraceum DSM 14365]
MRLAFAVIFAVAVAAGCGQRKLPTAAPVVEVPEREELSLLELRRDLEATVLENYLQLGLGNMEAYADSISRDDQVTLLGLSPGDVFLGANDDCGARSGQTAPESALASRGGCDRASDRLPFRYGEPCLPSTPPTEPCQGVFSKLLDLQISRDGTVAWVADEISYRIPYRGRQAAMPLRYTGVFVRDGGRWVLVSEHLSYPLPSDLILDLACRGELSALNPLAEREVTPSPWSALLRHLAPDRATRTQLAEALRGYQAAREHISESRLILMPDVRDEMRDAEIFTPHGLDVVFGGQVALDLQSLRAFRSPSESVLWTAANVDMSVPMGARQVIVPLRMSAVFERSAADAPEPEWQLMQAHVAVPLRRELLARRVFGNGVRVPAVVALEQWNARREADAEAAAASGADAPAASGAQTQPGGTAPGVLRIDDAPLRCPVTDGR